MNPVDNGPHRPGQKFMFAFGAPQELFDKELYYDSAKGLPYYRVYATRNPGNKRYMFTDSKGKKHMVVRAKSLLPVINCQLCGEKATSFCGSCQKIPYCSVECQQEDWSVHKEICK